MKRIAVVGTGYVGLVTGVCLSEIGHQVTCLDIDRNKIENMKLGNSLIYEPGLDELMIKNIKADRLSFTTSKFEACSNAEIIYIAVGTPQNEDGSANIQFVEQVVKDIAKNISRDGVIIVIKSTVPVGTNNKVKQWIKSNLKKKICFEVVSNPEFLREGSAIHDTFYGDRIVIGAESDRAASILEEINRPFGLPVFKTDIFSAEMIKYASNAFLATKISFINEIANICEKLGADIEDIAYGMGLDTRIGSKFLNAGIGYGGACFPKDTRALVQIAGNVEHKFKLLEAVINVNNEQQRRLIEKARSCFCSLKNKKIALLGLSFKPKTDDMREAASIIIAEQLVEDGAKVVAYDPIAMESAKKILGNKIEFATSIRDTLLEADAAFILTEWDEIRNIPLEYYNTLMKNPVVFDGRNCYMLDEVKKHVIEYHSIGRPPVKNLFILANN
ncbi:UDPglucose 6-dehydrogenase [Bacillus sp. TE9106W]|nr:UDP-glucose/GDP-mannose dehydrogenase family protein [Bacillus cereus]